MQDSVEKIIDWLQKQVLEAKVNGLVVGLSGGLDSAVVAYLIKRAFPNNSLAVVMPLKTNPKDLEDANRVIQGCDIEQMTIDLTETHHCLFSTIQKEFKKTDELNEDKVRLGDANLRARLRMSTLYTIASNHNYLVVGTDNASEWFTGYFTKYGDGGVDILPIISFTKQEIYEMARFLGVPETVINKQPSADLWEGQTDEEEMGTTYNKIDAYLKGEDIPQADKQVIERMHNQTEHKRNIAKQLIIK